ncbi:hypothetical protein WJX73_003495 [Symbiochloris irregularis]|uniref:Ribonuclease n=1 Tax=Symbiochloris irregularis TaxID=706552 RepID=A0AAW1NWW4_9CHLO
MISAENTGVPSTRRRSARLAAAEPRDHNGRETTGLDEVPRRRNTQVQPVAQPPVSNNCGPSRDLEEGLWDRGFQRVAGIDEAGRGPLAGPVVAAACHVPADVVIQGVKDSKKLSAKRREELYELLTNEPHVSVSTCVIEPLVIDEINILQATLLAMHRAANELRPPADFHLVDGLQVPKGVDTGTWRAVTGGDDCCHAIAAASIIAKVTRDRLMMQYHEQWPQYGFADHKGYGTKKHMAALKQHGPCPIHRRSFEPIKSGLYK